MNRIQTASRTGNLSLWLATAAVALAAGFSQTALADPQGGKDGHGRGEHRMGGHEMGGHGIGGHGIGQGRHMAGMLDAAKATPEQRAQIHKLMQDARSEMKAQREAGKALHSQEMALFAQPNLDARTAETLRQQQMAQIDQTSKRMTKLKLDISGVLTPEQRKAVADRMAQRRSMHDRHQAEREALGRGSK